jgi:hypothetical protein
MTALQQPIKKRIAEPQAVALTAVSSRSHRARGLTAEVAAHGNALRIAWPGELTAVPSAAIVRKRADQLISGRDKHPQCRC